MNGIPQRPASKISDRHLALANDKNHNTGERMIANLEPTADCKWIRIVVQSNGAFTITNGRNTFSKSCVALAR